MARSVAAYARDLRAARPEVRRILWFGSWVNGIPAPGSDVDLCLVLTGSDLLSRDRIPRYLPTGFPVGIDLFVYTEAELDRLKENHASWYRCIMSGKEM